MKYKLFSVLIILAMVASLCAVAVVAPIASADVVPATVTTTNNLAGKMSGYTVAFTLGGTGSLTASTDEVYITFPAGTDLPSTMDYTNVLVSTGGTPTAANVGSGGVSVSGQTVTVRMPMGAPNDGTVTVSFAQSLGIVNPALSMEPAPVAGDGQGTTGYMVQVRTSNANDSTNVASNPYYIYNWVTASPMAAAASQVVTITGGGFMPGQSVAISGGASTAGTIGTVEADGTFSMTGFGVGFSIAVTALDGSARTASTTAMTALPSLSVSPASGNIGSSIVLTGKNFAMEYTSGTPTITIGGTAVSNSTLALSDVDKDGAPDDFVFTTTIPIGLPSGAKVVRVVDINATGSPAATATVTVAEQKVVAAPASGAAGSTIVLTGAGWPPNAISGGILLWSYGGGLTTAIGDFSVETDGTGAFTEVATIPTNAPAGTSAIVCSFGASTALAFVTVTPNALSLSPTSGPKGTRVTISGGGLTASSTADVTIGGAAWNTTAINLDTQGNLTPTTLAIANTVSEGVNTVVAIDATGITAAGTFEVIKPTIELDATEAYAGQTVTVTGSDFLPGVFGIVSIQLQIAGVWTTMTVATPNADGNIWAQFQIPSTVGVNTTVAYRATDNPVTPTSGNSTLAGALKIPAANLAVDPESGPVGSTAHITGTGFLPLTGITSLTIGTSGVALAPAGTILTDSLGSFEADVIIPGLAVGGQPVSATDSITTASTSFTITAAAGAATPATGFATISDCIIIAWAFDAATQQWQVYDPSEGATSTLSVLSAGQGYWINVAEDCTLTFGANTYNLVAGWNLIGWLG